MTTCYSFDGERFYYGCLGDALCEFDSHVYQHGLFTVYLGDIINYQPSSFAPDVDSIEEIMLDRAYGEHDDYAEDWEPFAKEDHEEITRRIHQVIDEFSVKPDFWGVRETQQVVFNWSVLSGRVVRVS